MDSRWAARKSISSASASARPLRAIEASSRLKRDGSVNQGFSAKAIDLSTLRFELTQLEEDTDPTSVPLSLPLGVTDTDWELSYNDITIYSGNSVYVEEYQNDGTVPGAGTTGVTFYSNEDYDTA
jgi:hypothetical protein